MLKTLIFLAQLVVVAYLILSGGKFLYKSIVDFVEEKIALVEARECIGKIECVLKKNMLTREEKSEMIYPYVIPIVRISNLKKARQAKYIIGQFFEENDIEIVYYDLPPFSEN